MTLNLFAAVRTGDRACAAMPFAGRDAERPRNLRVGVASISDQENK